MKTYKVLSKGKERPMYEVVFDGGDNKAICSCHMFEFVGILCRHVLAIFVKKSLDGYLPQQYIIRKVDNKRKGA